MVNPKIKKLRLQMIYYLKDIIISFMKAEETNH